MMRIAIVARAVTVVRAAMKVMGVARIQEATMKGTTRALVMMKATKVVIKTMIMKMAAIAVMVRVKAEHMQNLVMRQLGLHLWKVSLAILFA